MELTDLLDKNKKIVENHIKKFFYSIFYLYLCSGIQQF